MTNLARHLDRTFDLWNLKNPDTGTKAKRTLIFLSSLLIIALWPVDRLLINLLLIILVWLLLAITNKPVNRWILMFNMELNIAWLFYMVNYVLINLK